MSKTVEIIRSAYDGLQEEYSLASGIACTAEEGKTVQSEARNADLNYLLRDLRGEVRPVVGASPNAFYADVSEIGDYHSSLNVLLAAKQAFEAQPAHIRDRFENDAEKFVEFVQDDNNREEAVKLGLIEGKIPPVDNPATAFREDLHPRNADGEFIKP